MNVTHVADSAVPVPSTKADSLTLMFERQLALMEEYRVIEANNGFPKPLSTDLDDRYVQFKVKDMAWRFTEELTESTSSDDADPVQREVHQVEELMDAMHFLLELNIMVGFTSGAFYSSVIDALGPPFHAGHYDRLEYIYEMIANNHEGLAWTVTPVAVAAWRCVEALGCAMNCLKNKPWKSTHMMTDTSKFFKYLGRANAYFLILCSVHGMTAAEVFRVYYKKSEVNKFRVRSNY